MGYVRADLVGSQFGKLKVVAFAGLDVRRNALWLCQCECGEQRRHTASNLRKGIIVSCGCWGRRKRVATRAEDHPDFHIFTGMLDRCHNQRGKNYRRYGGRGIAVCDRWRDGGFRVFIADMGCRPTADHTIERKDNDGPYSPENCIWATQKEQAQNRRTNRRITFNGTTLTMSQWAERLGVNYKTLKARISKGWPLDRAMTAETFNRTTSEEVILAIRAARAEGLTMQAVADRFRVSISVVHKVCSGRELAGLPPLPRNSTAAGHLPAAGRHDSPTA